MKNLKQYLNFAFELYDRNNEQIEKIDGPGDLFIWMRSPESPDYVALYPVPYNNAVEILGYDRTRKVVRIPFDENEIEHDGQREEIIMYFPDSLAEAREKAKALGCDYFYWSEWDGNRYLAITDSMFDGDVWKDPSVAYYYNED